MWVNLLCKYVSVQNSKSCWALLKGVMLVHWYCWFFFFGHLMCLSPISNWFWKSINGEAIILEKQCLLGFMEWCNISPDPRQAVSTHLFLIEQGSLEICLKLQTVLIRNFTELGFYTFYCAKKYMKFQMMLGWLGWWQLDTYPVILV